MRKYYDRLAIREKLLLLGFLLLLGGFWLWGGVVRSARLWHRWQDDHSDLAGQELWLARRTEIEAAARDAARTLKPELTLDATKLFSEVNQIARGLTYEVGGQRSEQSEHLAIHAVQLTLRKVDMDALLQFNTEVQKRAPYLGIEQAELSADRSDAGKVNATFRLYSIQVQSPTKD